ncbi:MAG: hypothetical protein FJ144_04860 [Deltaproteobacteria bacterium]|nr:hypothetical protein [Deltaproteobacteria bacterium]
MGDATLRRWARFVVERRRAVIAALAIVTGVLAVGLRDLRLEVDPDRNLPPAHPAIQALDELHGRFGDKNLVVIGLFPNDGDAFGQAFLRKVAEVSRGIASLPGHNEALFQSLASPEMQDVRGSDEGIEVGPLLETPPASADEARAVRERVLRNPAYVGTLVSPSADAVAIYATFELSEELPGYERIYSAVRERLVEAEDGTFTWALSGPVVLAGALGIESARVVHSLPLAFVLIGLIHYHAFRTLQAILLPVLTAVLAVFWSLGAMGLAGVPLDPFTTTTPVLILAVAAGHAVQILKRYYEELTQRGNEDAVVESIARVGPVMVAAGTIAILAFLSLTTFGLATLRTFGLFAALGIASTLLIELTLIPAVRAALPTPGEQESHRERTGHPWIDAVLQRLARDLPKRAAAPILAIAVAVLVVCGIFALRVQVDTSFKRHFAPGTEVFDQEERLNRHFAGTSTLVFLIEGPRESAILEPGALRAIDRFERRMEELPGVGKALSVVDRLRFLHRALVGDPEAALPDRAALAKQVLFSYELSGGAALATEITPDERIAKVVVLLRDDSTRYGAARIADAKRILAEELPPGYVARIAGTLASNEALTEVMVRGKLGNIAQFIAVTLVVGAVLLRSLLAGVLVVVPLALAVAVDFGVMGAFTIPLDVVTAPVAALAVGMGADYAVYFLFRLREEYSRNADFPAALAETYETSGKSIVFVASAIIAGYATLCLSGFSVHVRLGALVAIAMLAAAVASLTILPALVCLLVRGRGREAVLGDVLEPPGERA